MITSFGVREAELDLGRDVSVTIAGRPFTVRLEGTAQLSAEFEVTVSTTVFETSHYEPPPSFYPPAPAGTTEPGYWEDGVWHTSTRVVDLSIHVPQPLPPPQVSSNAELTVSGFTLGLAGEDGLAGALLGAYPDLRPEAYLSALGDLDLAAAARGACAGSLDQAWSGLIDFSIEDWELWSPAGVTVNLGAVQDAARSAFDAAVSAGRQLLDDDLGQALLAGSNALRDALVALAEELIDELNEQLFEAAAVLKLALAQAQSNPLAATRTALAFVVERLLAPFAQGLPAALDWICDTLEWLLDWIIGLIGLGAEAVLDTLARLIASAAGCWDQARERVERVVQGALANLNLSAAGQRNFAVNLIDAVLEQPAVGALLAAEA